MSINLSVGVMIPTNVVEVGNEISADQLAAITSASNVPTAGNPFATNAFVTGQGYITSAPPAYRTVITGSNTSDSNSNTYIYVLDNSETLTIDDSPPNGTLVFIVFIAGTAGYVSCASGVTLNGGSGTSFSGTIKTLIKIATNTWWIG